MFNNKFIRILSTTGVALATVSLPMNADMTRERATFDFHSLKVKLFSKFIESKLNYTNLVICSNKESNLNETPAHLCFGNAANSGVAVPANVLASRMVRIYSTDSIDLSGPTGLDDLEYLGSGFVISPEGMISTAYHLLEGERGKKRIYVRTADDVFYSVVLQGKDESSDICVLKPEHKLENKPATYFDVSSSSQSKYSNNNKKLLVGEPVFTAGTSQYALQPSLVAGSVCQTQQKYPTIEEETAIKYVPFIQVAMTVTNGLSGSAVVDSDGSLVGMLVQKYEEFGLVTPFWHLQDVLQDLIIFGERRPNTIGVAVGMYRPCRVAKEIEEKGGGRRRVEFKMDSGLPIVQIVPNSPAAMAGLAVGMKILSIDDVPLKTVMDVYFQARTLKQHKFLVEVEPNTPPKVFFVTPKPYQP